MQNPYAAPNAALVEPILADGTYDPILFSLNGRIGRLRYLAYNTVLLFGFGIILSIIVGVYFGLSSVKMSVAQASYMPYLTYAIILLPGLFMARRRLQDLDHSNWFCVVMLVPYVNSLAGLYLMFARGTEGENRYGPPPSKNTALVIFGAVLLPIISVIGILAAVAIPAYQTYTQRVHAAQVDKRI